ncbi:hypothetical protein B7463_g7400, partial [Scytalidium lignicola]
MILVITVRANLEPLITLKIIACAGTESVQAQSRIWYQPRSPIPGLVICGACYYDRAAVTPMAEEFIPIPVPQASYLNSWSCDMALLPMKVAWTQATLTKDFNIWWEAARTIMNSSVCSNKGIVDGIWYTLAQGYKNFNIYARYYAGFIHALGYGSAFARKFRPPGQTLLCDLNPTAPRFQSYVSRLEEAERKRSLSIFTDYVVKFAALPLCPRSTMVKDRRWYGSPDFLICENCFEEVVKDTYLSSQLPYQNVEISGQRMCDLYSPRMRKLWSEACCKQDLTSFTEFARHRTQIYAMTMPRIQMILGLMRSRIKQQAALFTSSIMLQGANNIVTASQSSSQYSYGNSTVGYGFSTPAGVQGAMQFKQALNMNPGPGNEFVEVAQLEAMWKEVE